MAKPEYPNGRRGRPPMSRDDKRSAKSLLAYRRREYADVCRAAREEGMTPAEFARRAALARARTGAQDEK